MPELDISGEDEGTQQERRIQLWYADKLRRMTMYLCPGSGGKGGDWDMFLEIMRGFLWWDHVCIVPMRVVWDRVWPPASNDQG